MTVNPEPPRAQHGRESTLDEFIEEARAAWNNVGVAVAVVRHDDIAYTYASGLRSVGNRLPIDADTLFQIGSVTKSFTATALAIASEATGTSFDTRVADVVTGLSLGDGWLTRQVTLRDLLAHRVGLSVNIYPYLAPFTQERALEQLKYLKPAARFRDCFQYDNLMYGLAGKAIEVLSGTSWHRFVRERLFEPLRMSRSATSTSDVWPHGLYAPTFMGSCTSAVPRLDQALTSNVAMPHGWDENGHIVPLCWQGYDNTAAAGSLISSATDMAHYLIMHLNGGKFEGRQIVPPGPFKELHAPQNLHTAAKQLQFLECAKTYALGWERARYRGLCHLAHGGGIIGFPAYVAMLPEPRLGLVILSNGPKITVPDYTLEQLFHKAIAFGIFDVFLQSSSGSWIDRFLELAAAGTRACELSESRLRAGRISGTTPTVALEHLAGIYADESGHSGEVFVRLEDGRLKFQFSGDGAFSARLDHWHGDTFRIRQTPSIEGVLGPQFVTFHLHPDGAVRGFSAFGEYGGLFERRGAEGSVS